VRKVGTAVTAKRERLLAEYEAWAVGDLSEISEEAMRWGRISTESERLELAKALWSAVQTGEAAYDAYQRSCGRSLRSARPA
jgi:hypothetical protein